MSHQETEAPIASRPLTSTRPSEPDAESPVGSSLEALTDPRRRRILSVLLEHGGAIDETVLATHLAAAETEPRAGGVDGDAVDSVVVDLRHVQLPALDEEDLVGWDREGRSVAVSDHSALDDPGVRAMLSGDLDPPGASTALEEPRRRRIVTALLDADRPMGRSELAATIDDTDSSSIESSLVRLHHVDLPHLEAAGLVELGPDGETAEYVGGDAAAELARTLR